VTLAVIGGTFDPVHLGHLILAEEIRAEFSLDRVLFVPAFAPAHKSAPDPAAGGASPADRLRMLECAIGSVAGFAVDDCEIRRGGVSYTIDTLGELIRSYAPEGKPALVIGDDLIEGFPLWRKPEAIAATADLILAHRSSAEERPFPYPHVWAHNLLIPVSSSLIRSRIRRGLPVRFLLPEGVRQFIEARGLYR